MNWTWASTASGSDGTLWSAGVAEEFRRRKGYDLSPELPALFMDIGPRTPKVRLDYRDVMVALSEENYFRPLFQWNLDRGMLYGCDHGCRGCNVVEFGDYYRTQRWMLGPGNDSPGMSPYVIRKNKVNSSIAHLYQRPRVWLEGFYGSGWGTTPANLTKHFMQDLAAGSNLLALHGLYYSTHGGWWEWAPPCNHYHMPYWAHMGNFSTLLPATHLSPEPRRPPLRRGRNVSRGADGSGHERPSGHPTWRFRRATACSAREGHGIDFDYMDFQSLARAKVEDRQLHVSGEIYRALVLPSMSAVRYSTMQKALEFYRAGGLVIAVGALPEASERVGRDDPELDAMVKEVFGMTARQAAADQTELRSTQCGRRNRHARAAAGRSGRRCRQGFYARFHPAPAAQCGPHQSSIASQDRSPRRVYGPRCAEKLRVPFPCQGQGRVVGSVDRAKPGRSTASRFPRTGTRVRMPLEECEAQVIVFSPGEPALAVEQTDLDEITAVRGNRRKGQRAGLFFYRRTQDRAGPSRRCDGAACGRGPAPTPPVAARWPVGLRVEAHDGQSFWRFPLAAHQRR